MQNYVDNRENRWNTRAGKEEGGGCRQERNSSQQQAPPRLGKGQEEGRIRRQQAEEAGDAEAGARAAMVQADLGGDTSTHADESATDSTSTLVLKTPGGNPREQTGPLNPTVYRANLLRLLNALTDPSAAVRKKSLSQLRELMLKEGQIELRLGRNELQVFTESQVLKPLLRRFEDSSSACRELALELTVRLLEKVPDAVLSLLPYAIPALGERLARYDSTAQADSMEQSYAPEISFSSCTADAEKSGTEANNAPGMATPARRRGSGPVEEVEENRLLLAKLLRSILRHSGKAIGAYAADVAAMLMSSVADPSPEVAQELCACCEDYAAKLGLRLRQVAKPMIGAVTPLLGAKRQKVRCAALRAIRKLVACGGSEAILDLTGFRDPNLIPVKAFYEAKIKTNWFALLALDPTVSVRREFLATLGDWLLNLPERNDYETRLLPYVLSAFSDENPTVRSEAFELMEAIGRLYERDKEAELKDTRFYLPEESGGGAAVGSFLLPAPFTKRPCLGARMCVRGCFNRLVLPLVAELRAWTTGTKEHAVDLLRTMLVFVEENATQNVQPILLAFLQVMEDRSIAGKIKKCSRILGAFVPPSAYLLVLLPRIQGDLGDHDARTRTCAVALLADLLSAASPDGVRSGLPDITSALTEPDFLHSRSGRLREATSRVMGEVVRVWKAEGELEWGEELVPVLWILLHLASTEGSETPGEESTVLSIMGSLAQVEGFRSGADLLSAHLASILPLLSPASTWHTQARDLQVYCLIKSLTSAASNPPDAESLAAVEEEARLSPHYNAFQSRLEGK